MKRVLTMLAAVAFAASPLVAQAATFGSGQDYSRSPQEMVSGDLYVAAGTVSVGSPTSGDLVAAGGTVTINGGVGNDATLAGGTVQLLGAVGDDVRITGGQVTIGDRIGDDVFVMAGNVHVLSTAVIGGDIYVMGGRVVIDGTVRGKVTARISDSLVLGSTSRIDGTLSYYAPKEAQMAQGARVGGKVTFSQTGMHVGDRTGKGILWALVGMLTAMVMLAYLGMTAVLVWHWRRWSVGMLQEAHDAFWPSIGRGLVYMILVPIGGVLLLVSFIGTVPGILLLMLYGMTMILAKVMAGMFLGAWIWKVAGKRKALEVTWVNAIVGTILFPILSMIPIVGWVGSLLVTLAVFGVLAHMVQRRLFA